MRLTLTLTLFTAGVAAAQWINYPTPGTPRTRDGKPKLSASVPRTSGKPDLSGVWMHEPTPLAEARRLFGESVDEFAAVDVPGMEAANQIKYSVDILVDFRPEEALMRPAAVEQTRRNQVLFNSGAVTGCSAGYVVGFPQAGLVSEPIKIVQAPRLTMILYEAGSLGNMYRHIYTDGRALPTEYSLPAYLGYSVGHWEGDTFVVETAGFNDKTTLDALGHPHSDALRVTERFHRRDFGHLDVEMTFDDPKMYTKPFTVKIPHNLVADGDIFEMFCENEKDLVHLPKP